jgi:hypothetical protein
VARDPGGRTGNFNPDGCVARGGGGVGSDGVAGDVEGVVACCCVGGELSLVVCGCEGVTGDPGAGCRGGVPDGDVVVCSAYVVAVYEDGTVALGCGLA